MNDPKTGESRHATRQRILLVEDNSAAGLGLSRLLDARGYEVTAVTDGASALAALRTNPPPDFVLTDLQLPDLDGLEIARQVRELEPRPTVALITGWDMNASDEDYARWGIDWVCPKPVDVEDLIQKLNRAPRSGGDREFGS